MRKNISIIAIILLTTTISFASTTASDSLTTRVKTGWTFGALPAITFDSDLGFQYGGIVNLYYYGDGST